MVKPLGLQKLNRRKNSLKAKFTENSSLKEFEDNDNIISRECADDSPIQENANVYDHNEKSFDEESYEECDNRFQVWRHTKPKRQEKEEQKSLTLTCQIKYFTSVRCIIVHNVSYVLKDTVRFPPCTRGYSKYATLWIIASLVASINADSCAEAKITVKEVSGCPTTEGEWNNKARELNCSSIQQSCTDPSKFTYHCLVNAFRQVFVEVCAPTKVCHGYCPEYNYGGERVQDNYEADCTNHTKPCPVHFMSNEVYKYPSCLKINRIVTETPEHDNNSNMRISGVLEYRVSLLVCFVVVGCAAMVFIIRWNKRKMVNCQSGKCMSEDDTNAKLEFIVVNDEKRNDFLMYSTVQDETSADAKHTITTKKG